MNIEQRVKAVIASQLGASIISMDNNASLSGDLGADSLDIVEIIMAMEEEFEQTFQDESIKIENIQDIIDFVSKTLNKTDFS